jgi:glutathione peroxidase
MRKTLFITLLVLLTTAPIMAQHKTLYDFSARTIDGHDFDFSSLKGKKVMIVNTASECALTSQYNKLQELYEEYGGDDFEILAFPSNDFGNQEPGSNEQIKEFCISKYNVSFTIMEKTSIKGNDMHPIFRWLTSSEENGILDGRVTWNFQKFLIDENGQPTDFLPPVKGPYNRRIIEWLQQ